MPGSQVLATVPPVQPMVSASASQQVAVAPEATRFSNRQREMGAAARGGRGPRGGRRGRGGRGGRGVAAQPSTGIVPSFTMNFSFVEYTDDELISLFEVTGFFLGDSLDSKRIVINYIRGLQKDRFDSVLSDILDLQKSTSDPVDIRSRVMLESSLGII